MAHDGRFVTTGSGATRALFVAVALALSGCSGDGSALLTGAAVPASPTVAAPTETTSDKPSFNPFSDRTETDTAAREVIKNPTLADIHQPAPLPEFTLGRADAPVVLVKYMSLTCPFCRRFQSDTFPALKREYIDTGKVRLILREFPIGKSSGTATIALRCAPMEKYLDVYERFLRQQAAWVSQEVRLDAIHKVAAGAGLTREQFDKCLKNQAMIDALKKVKDRGRQLGIIGTPNFFIGDRLVKKVVGIEELRSIIDPMLAGRRS